MSDGTVKVTAEAHLHLQQLTNMLPQLTDMLSQITSHGVALTDPNVWAGPAASMFSSSVWPEVNTLLGQLTPVLGGVQQQVGGILNGITQAGSGGLPGLGVVNSLPVVGGLVGGLTNGL